MKIKVNNTNTPTWRSVTVKSALPAKLKMLEELSKNLWWVWNSEGKTASTACTTISRIT